MIKADGSDPMPTRLTFTPEGELGPHWIPSRDGEKNKILYQRPLVQGQGQQQIWVMNADGTEQTQLTGLTALEGTNQFPNWGVIRSRCDVDDDDNGDDGEEDWERRGEPGGEAGGGMIGTER